MFAKTALADWEALVKKQLKTDDILSVLVKDNLEGVSVKAYYDEVKKPLTLLPKIEESTHLVAYYQGQPEDNVYAFLVDKDVAIADVEDKTFFIEKEVLFSNPKDNKYFSLIDVFDEENGTLNKTKAEELLAQGFVRSLCVDVSLHQNAGASIIQQLGFALAKTKELVEVFGKETFNKLIFKVAVGHNYFFEMAKLRALKLLINQLSKEYGLDEIPYIFAETSLRNKAKNDEENNLIRSTLELASAMIGGADAVFSNDFKLENQTSLSEEISFKQEIILAYESLINVFEDASNGSYYVEDLTQQFAEKAWQHFLEIENNGGYLENLKSGKIQEEIYQHATEEQRWIEEGKIKLIGVNLYPSLERTKNVEDLYDKGKIKPVRWAEMFE